MMEMCSVWTDAAVLSHWTTTNVACPRPFYSDLERNIAAVDSRPQRLSLSSAERHKGYSKVSKWSGRLCFRASYWILIAVHLWVRPVPLYALGDSSLLCCFDANFQILWIIYFVEHLEPLHLFKTFRKVCFYLVQFTLCSCFYGNKCP